MDGISRDEWCSCESQVEKGARSTRQENSDRRRRLEVRNGNGGCEPWPWEDEMSISAGWVGWMAL